MTQLPDLILCNIFSYLSTSRTYLCAISQVCKQWYQQSKNPLLWKNVLYKFPRGKVGENLYGKNSEGAVDFRKMCMAKGLCTKWSTPVHPVTLNGHNATIACIDFDGKHAITGSADGQMKIWNVEKGECVKTLQQHTEAVRALQFDSSKIISASEDQTLRLWKLGDGSVSVLQQFKYSLRSLHFDGNAVVCGGVNPIISAIDIPTSKLKCQLKGHTGVVYSVDLHGNTVISGAADNLVKLWDIRSSECLHTLNSHIDAVRRAQLVGHLVASASSDKTVKIWDTRKLPAITPVEVVEFEKPVIAAHFDGLRFAATIAPRIYFAADGFGIKSASISNATCVRFTPKSPTVLVGYGMSLAILDFCPRGRKRKNK
eukprot:Phypoly_transcript_11971.p1 GENE.Phypoly_transcript_11971~~Phypoly_transcript_11971.p1  ORF type:complete len:384 (+),score=52.72 Phypoly_transcript_11971:42-1154(+)